MLLPAKGHGVVLGPLRRNPAPEEAPIPRACTSSAIPRSLESGVSTSPFSRALHGNEHCLHKLRMSCQGLAGAQQETALWHLHLQRERSISKAGSDPAPCQGLGDAERPLAASPDDANKMVSHRPRRPGPVPTWMAACRARRAFSSRIFRRSSSFLSCKSRIFPSSIRCCLSFQRGGSQMLLRVLQHPPPRSVRVTPYPGFPSSPLCR